MQSIEAASNDFINILSDIFVDRDEETRIIRSEYAGVLKGEKGLVVVTGGPGVGKTCLIKHATAQLGQNTFIYGKSKQNQDSALISISEVINQVVDHLIMLPTNILEAVRLDLDKTISDDMTLLASISPKVINLIDVKKKFGISDFNRLKYRVKNTVYQFLDIASRYLFPLVIYIDDIQWADSLSLEIMKTLAGKKQGLNVMLLFSFRDNETSSKMKSLISLLQSRATLIELNPLNLDEVIDYINIAFDKRINNAKRLASILLGFTMGNPFYIKETLLILLKENIINYLEEDQSWSIQIKKMNNFFINDNAAKVIKKKIIDESDEILDVIACSNGKIEYNILSILINKDRELLNDMLKRHMDSAIIVEQEENGCIFYLFTHDIIHKLVLGGLSLKQKQSIHYRIANSLFSDALSNAGLESYIVSNLLKADINDVCKDAGKWIEILFNVGKAEKQRASIDTSLKIFELCKEALIHSTTSMDSFYLDLHLELAECLELCGRREESEQIMGELVESYFDKKSRLQIKRKQLYLYYYHREHKKAIKVGASILKDLRFGFGRHRLVLDLIISRFVYSNKKISSLSEASGVVNEKVRIILDTLTIMNTCAAVSDDKYTASIGLSAALTSAKCGESANSMVGYISYAYVLYVVWNDLNKAEQMVQQILKMSDRISDPSNKSMVFFMIGAFLSHWAEPIKKADYYLQKGVQYGDQSGDFLFLGHCITTSLDTKSTMGNYLDSTLDYINDCRMKYSETEQYTTTYNLEAHEAHINALKYGIREGEFNKIGSKYPKLTPFEKLTEYTLQMELLLLTGNLEQGYKIVKLIEADIKATKGLICRQNIIFYSLLLRIVVHNKIARKEQPQNKRHIKQMLKELEQSSRQNEDNFQCYYLLAKAEYLAYIEEQPSDLYNLAAQKALLQGNLKIGALANLLAARKHKDNAKLSELYASESARLHKLWGAVYISELIENEYALLRDEDKEAVQGLTGNASQTKKQMLYEFAGKAYGTDETDAIELLLNTLIRMGVADYCCMITKESNQLYMKHQINKDGTVNSFSEDIKIGNLRRLPQKVIRYSSRTHKEVLLPTAESKSLFDTDPYIVENPNVFIACIPIFNCGVVAGLLYLENRQEPFDEDTVFEIKSILPALAVSLKGINGIIIKDLFAQSKKQTLLTNREMDILRLLAKGLSNEYIAQELSLSVGTVKKHVSSVLAKLGADNRTQALLKAKEKDIL